MSPPLGVQNVAVGFIFVGCPTLQREHVETHIVFFEMNTSNGPLLTGEIPPFHNLHVAK